MRISVFSRSLSVFAVLAIFSSVQSIRSQVVAQEKIAEIEKAIEAEMTASETPGAAVAVISSDKKCLRKVSEGRVSKTACRSDDR